MLEYLKFYTFNWVYVMFDFAIPERIINKVLEPNFSYYPSW